MRKKNDFCRDNGQKFPNMMRGFIPMIHTTKQTSNWINANKKLRFNIVKLLKNSNGYKIVMASEERDMLPSKGEREKRKADISTETMKAKRQCNGIFKNADRNTSDVEF